MGFTGASWRWAALLCLVLVFACHIASVYALDEFGLESDPVFAAASSSKGKKGKNSTTTTGSKGPKLKLIFSKDSWDQYSVGSSGDVGVDFKATSAGCTGVILKGRPCGPTPNNIKVALDPAGSSTKVMSVLYRRGQYATNGGAQFYTTFSELMRSNAGMLEYELYFPKNFLFTKGGKLPGLFGGDFQCSGSKVTPNGRNCFSSRLMWRQNGAGETYFYVPIIRQKEDFCHSCAFFPPKPSCNAIHTMDYCSWHRGSYSFPRGKWVKVQQYVKMNTPGKLDGVYQLYVDGKLVMSSTTMYFRATSALQLKGLLFSTFMGGDDRSWAPKQNQNTYYRNVRVYTG